MDDLCEFVIFIFNNINEFLLHIFQFLVELGVALVLTLDAYSDVIHIVLLDF